MGPVGYFLDFWIAHLHLFSHPKKNYLQGTRRRYQTAIANPNLRIVLGNWHLSSPPAPPAPVPPVFFFENPIYIPSMGRLYCLPTVGWLLMVKYGKYTIHGCYGNKGLTCILLKCEVKTIIHSLLQFLMNQTLSKTMVFSVQDNSTKIVDIFGLPDVIAFPVCFAHAHDVSCSVLFQSSVPTSADLILGP